MLEAVQIAFVVAVDLSYLNYVVCTSQVIGHQRRCKSLTASEISVAMSARLDFLLLFICFLDACCCCFGLRSSAGLADVFLLERGLCHSGSINAWRYILVEWSCHSISADGFLFLVHNSEYSPQVHLAALA